MNVKVRQTCRLCKSKELTPIFDLGGQMLASHFHSKENEDRIPTRKVPLELVRCNPERDENACGLVQLKHTFPSELMYTEYWYRSGVNQTMKTALKDLADKSTSYAALKSGDVVVDIGCNDGTLLNAYDTKGLTKIGFDPAQNFDPAEDTGFQRISTYFNKESYSAVQGNKKAKAVTSIAMFYDLEDPSTFTQDIADILADDGIWVLQMADLPNMLVNNMFDNICHEHLCYYHLAPLEFLLNRHGLKLVDIEMNFVNGSSYRLYIRKNAGPSATSDALDRIAKVRFSEFNMALDTDAPYLRFKNQTEKNKNDLTFFINQVREQGKTVFVYGASTKGNVLLQYCGLTEKEIPFAADRNPMKWGTRTLGSDIPIISEEDARKKKPDYFLVLPYHFLQEMIEREQDFLKRGGKFIVPVPQVRTVSG